MAQQTAVWPAKPLSHFAGSGTEPALPAMSRPGQSPTPTPCHPVGTGSGAGVAAAAGAAQVYIWPGFAPPVHEPAATVLYVQPVLQHTAVCPAKFALHLPGSGFGPDVPATSRPGQSPTPTDCQLPVAGAAGVVPWVAAHVYSCPGFAPPVHELAATFL